MIKYTGTRNGKPFLGIGLSEKNIEQLKKGKPIAVDGKAINLGFDVFVHYGKTEDDMKKELADLGVLPAAIMTPEGRG